MPLVSFTASLLSFKLPVRSDIIEPHFLFLEKKESRTIASDILGYMNE